VRTYDFFDIGTVTRTRLSASLREGSPSSFAYILHLEFPEPGMYSFERLFDRPMHKWLLWDRQWMVRQLYLLREAGGRLGGYVCAPAQRNPLRALPSRVKAKRTVAPAPRTRLGTAHPETDPLRKNRT
jgi:hypothetical protein